MCVLLSLPGSAIVHSSTCLDSSPLLTAFSSILHPNEAFLGSPCKRSPYNPYHWISRKTSTKLKIKAHGLIHRLSTPQSLSSTQKAHTKGPLGHPKHDTFRCPWLCICCFLCPECPPLPDCPGNSCSSQWPSLNTVSFGSISLTLGSTWSFSHPSSKSGFFSPISCELLEGKDTPESDLPPRAWYTSGA